VHWLVQAAARPHPHSLGSHASRHPESAPGTKAPEKPQQAAAAEPQVSLPVAQCPSRIRSRAGVWAGVWAASRSRGSLWARLSRCRRRPCASGSRAKEGEEGEQEEDVADQIPSREAEAVGQPGAELGREIAKEHLDHCAVAPDQPLEEGGWRALGGPRKGKRASHPGASAAASEVAADLVRRSERDSAAAVLPDDAAAPGRDRGLPG
jgi:hypothetical protein